MGGRPEFKIEDPVGLEEAGEVAASTGSVPASTSGPANGGRPTFEIEDPIDDAPGDSGETTWTDLLLSYADGVSLNHGRLGEEIGNWYADEMGLARPQGTVVEGKGLMDSVPDNWKTKGAKFAGNLTTAALLAPAAGSGMAGHAALGAAQGLASAHGAGESMGRGALLGGIGGALGAHLAKPLAALAKGAAPKSVIPTLEAAGTWFEPTGYAAREAVEASAKAVVEQAAKKAAAEAAARKIIPEGLGAALKSSAGGAASGAALAGITGGDWKSGALYGALGVGGAKALPGVVGTMASRAGSSALNAVGSYGPSVVRTAAQAAIPGITGRVQVPSNDRALNWSVQSVLHGGNTGLPEADEARLTAAVTSGDDDRVKSINYQLQMKYPEYAARVRGQLGAVQQTEE